MAWISTSVIFMPYSKLYILTELSANDVKFISVDRQRLDLKNIYTFGTVNSIFVEIQPDSTNIKNDPRKANKLSLIKTALWKQSDLGLFCLHMLFSIWVMHFWHSRVKIHNNKQLTIKKKKHKKHWPFTFYAVKILKLKNTYNVPQYYLNPLLHMLFLDHDIIFYFWQHWKNSRNIWVKFFCLFDLILYVPSTIFQLNRDGSSWVDSVLS